MARSFVVSGIIRIKDQGSRIIGRVRKSLGNLTSFLSSKFVFTAGDVVNAVKSITRAFGSLITAAGDQEAAIASATQAMRAAGESTGDAAGSIIKFAESLQRTTTIADTTALEMFALARGFAETNEQAKEIVRVSADFAVAAKINIEEGVRRIGRAFSGSVEDIAKFAPAILDLTKTQLKAGEATKLLGLEVSGFAATAAKTSKGELAQLSNAISSLQATIGTAITETSFWETVVVGLTGHILNLNAILPGYEQNIDAIGSAELRVVILQKRRKQAEFELREFMKNSVATIFNYIKIDRERARLIERLNSLTADLAKNESLLAEERRKQLAEARRIKDLTESQITALEKLGIVTKETVNREFRETAETLSDVQKMYEANQISVNQYMDAVERAAARQNRLDIAFEESGGNALVFRRILSELEADATAAAKGVDDLGFAAVGAGERIKNIQTDVDGAAIPALQRLVRMVQFTTANFDTLAASQGRATAVQAAIAAGGTVSGNRLRIPGVHGSRLVTLPGQGRNQFSNFGNIHPNTLSSGGGGN